MYFLYQVRRLNQIRDVERKLEKAKRSLKQEEEDDSTVENDVMPHMEVDKPQIR